METYGTIKINLSKLIKERSLSKNKLSHRADTNQSLLQQYDFKVGY